MVRICCAETCSGNSKRKVSKILSVDLCVSTFLQLLFKKYSDTVDARRNCGDTLLGREKQRKSLPW